MTREEIDIMWQQALQDSVRDGEMFTRYHFAKMVYDRGWMGGYTSCDNDNKTLTSALIADAVEDEREACAMVCDELDLNKGEANLYSQLIRERGDA